MTTAHRSPTPDADQWVQRRSILPVDADAVWRALTDPDELAAWWGAGTTLDPVPGGAGRFVEADRPTRVGFVVEADPGRRLRLDWWPEDIGDGDDDEPATRVTIDLEPCPFGTVVTITEAVLTDLVVHPPVFLAPRPWLGRAAGPQAVLVRA